MVTDDLLNMIIWDAVSRGEITPEQARAAIINEAEAAGGGGLPSWVNYQGPRRSILGGGAGLLGLVGSAGLDSAKEAAPEVVPPNTGLIDYLRSVEGRR